LKKALDYKGKTIEFKKSKRLCGIYGATKETKNIKFSICLEIILFKKD
jgi:hypothetical protein